MLPYSQRSDLFNQILILEDTSPQTAIECLKNFTVDYRLEECRSFIWSMVETCLTTENSSFPEPEDRADLLLRNNHFQKLFEAVFVLADHWNTQGKV
ncbi:MAG TPA: hypothetical protein VHD83_21830 [Puia sp.]|nr:hypothetical protein [Puia sp.]